VLFCCLGELGFPVLFVRSCCAAVQAASYQV